jgi:hypothetical protein
VSYSTLVEAAKLQRMNILEISLEIRHLLENYDKKLKELDKVDFIQPKVNYYLFKNPIFFITCRVYNNVMMAALQVMANTPHQIPTNPNPK